MNKEQMWFILWFLVFIGIDSHQFNLYYTDRVSESTSTMIIQHNCLYAAVISGFNYESSYEIVPYCLSESSSKWKIEKTNHHQKLTFAELRRDNISSQQLYLWSASMDIIERYQFYLDQSSNSNETKISKELFYNCTSPWFGPMCQYMFDQLEFDHSSFTQMIEKFYRNLNDMNSLTYYIYLKCNRGINSICLDWTDICNGIIDCIDGGEDEQHCWQLEINDCQDNEYRCRNGQCIFNEFHKDIPWSPDCLDGTDDFFHTAKRDVFRQLEPAFLCEEVTCPMSEVDEREFRILSSSSCVGERGKLMIKEMNSIDPNLMNDKCWFSFLCVIHFQQKVNNTECYIFCLNNLCQQFIKENCPDLISLPALGLMFGHVYFVYIKERLDYMTWMPVLPDYVCYNDKLCTEMLSTITLHSLNNSTCRRFEELPYDLTKQIIFFDSIIVHVKNIFQTCTSILNDYSSSYCNISTMYQCFNSSKCISVYRLNDGIRDCYYNDDEEFIVTEENSMKPFRNCYKCKQSNKCIARHLLNDGLFQCPFQDDETRDRTYENSKDILFPMICNGLTEMKPIIIDDREHTDETECEHWLCNNVYTRCDGAWNCLNGLDELNCHILPKSNCTPFEHSCISSETNQFICLPISQANDGIIHCLGATDEPLVCGIIQPDFISENFYCKKKGLDACIKVSDICSVDVDCDDGEDENFCSANGETVYCNSDDLPNISPKKHFFCLRLSDHRDTFTLFFSLDRIQNSIQRPNILDDNNRRILPVSLVTKTTRQYDNRCHRGIDMRVSLGKEDNSTMITCLCPPNYYGNTCQYQHQRVSFSMKIQAPSGLWHTQFVFVIFLIDDDERIIHSYEQKNYLSAKDCQRKSNHYLLYSTRPKNETKNYSIHIDAYEKETLNYRSSWLIPLIWKFLPVERIVAQLIIPHRSPTDDICLDERCIHGQCTKYVTNDTINNSFCRCNPGYSGTYCTFQYKCNCANNSLCVGITVDNRSICICPSGKFGDRCLLENTVCQFGENSTCLNGGQCWPIEERIGSAKLFSCICSKGFSGDKCQIIDTKIVVSFAKDISLPQSMLVHFIHASGLRAPSRVTILKKLYIGEDLVKIFWSHPFHIVIIELSKNHYYLTVVQKVYVESTTLDRKINLADRCLHINEIFNETITNLHPIRRIKYYHNACQRYSLELSCFYDEIHFCLCTDFEQQRVSNCFEFDHTQKYDCRGQSVCQNGAECFQDHPTCPQESICMCTECFYGRQCQFTIQGFGLSLDAILGYQILPHMRLRRQLSTVKISMALTAIMFALGILNGILSLITFRVKQVQEVGCGIYLLSSSINSILTITIFALKFCILLLSQMGSINNQSFLYIQCILVDFLLRICLSLDQWLNACVATERTVTVLQGAKFNKKMSKQVAKWVICVVILIVISSVIHDPIHRKLIKDNDNEEQRIWCIVTYSNEVNIFNSFVNIVHFFIPFLINIFSSIFIIVTVARQRALSRPRQTYGEHLFEQTREHKHLLFSSCLLILLAIPRVVISFISSCMKSARDPWLYLLAYFISFAPPILTFVVFVLPSKAYTVAFRKSLQQCRRDLRRRLCVNL